MSDSCLSKYYSRTLFFNYLIKPYLFLWMTLNFPAQNIFSTLVKKISRAFCTKNSISPVKNVNSSTPFWKYFLKKWIECYSNDTAIALKLCKSEKYMKTIKIISKIWWNNFLAEKCLWGCVQGTNLYWTCYKYEVALENCNERLIFDFKHF